MTSPAPEWSGRSVAVTGAAGFIGSHLSSELARRGATVRALVHYRSDGSRGLLDLLDAEELDALEIVAGDLRDSDWVRRALSGISCVFHLGALIGIPYSYASPRDVFATNVEGTLNVLEAARAHAIERVVQMSTSEVYGSAQRIPIDEAHPLSAQSPYAASKTAADQLALSFLRSFGVPVAIARPFNTFGPGQSARAVVPTIILQALTRERLRLGSTDTTRDLVYVADTVAGLLAIAASESTVGQACNLATGTETSIAEIVATVGTITGRALAIDPDPKRLRPEQSEVVRLVGDASRVRALCGWVASTSLRDGLERTVAWFREHLTRYRPDEYGV